MANSLDCRPGRGLYLIAGDWCIWCVRCIRRASWLLVVAEVAAAQGTPAVQTERPPLRFIVGEDWASPYLEVQAGRPVGGLALELMEKIAAAAGARAEYLMLPPKRTQDSLLAGDADLMCLMSPKWMARPLAAGRVGPPMVVLENVLAVPPGLSDRKPIDLSRQRGLRVGTVLGYRYEGIDPLFQAGQLVREDAATQQAVLEKLARGRTDVALVDRLVLAQYNQAHTEVAALRSLQVVSQTVTHCLLGGSTQWPARQLQRALQAVIDAGDVARLIQRYR